jgi:hypothetical protein
MALHIFPMIVGKKFAYPSWAASWAALFLIIKYLTARNITIAKIIVAKHATDKMIQVR